MIMVQINKMLRNPKMNKKSFICTPQQGRTVTCGNEKGVKTNKGGGDDGKRAEISFSLCS